MQTLEQLTGPQGAVSAPSFQPSSIIGGTVNYVLTSSYTQVTLEFISPGDYVWTCPAGTTAVLAECKGPGGVGGIATAATNGGGGGGGGAYAKDTITVSAGNYNLHVGFPGISDTTTFNATSVVADFGVNGSGSTGGAGGLVANCTGSVKFAGGTGGNGSTSSAGSGKFGGGSGGVSATSAGAGANGNPGVEDNGGAAALDADNTGSSGLGGTNSNGVDGTGYGNGGGGPSDLFSLPGAGSSGYVRLTYSLTTSTVGSWQPLTAAMLPVVDVPHGGTGLTTLTAHAVLLGEGTAAVGFAAIGTAGNLLLDQGAGVDPAFKAMSGDATISSAGVITIANAAVTLAKMANMATSSLIYRKTAGSGAPEVNTMATLKTDLGLTGTNSGDQTITLTGNVTGSGTGSFATTIAAGVVTEAMQVLADNTTANVSTSAHGYAPKAPSDATKFLNGANPPAWAVPGGGGTTGTNGTLSASPAASLTSTLTNINSGVPLAAKGTYLVTATFSYSANASNLGGDAGTCRLWDNTASAAFTQTQKFVNTDAAGGVGLNADGMASITGIVTTSGVNHQIFLQAAYSAPGLGTCTIDKIDMTYVQLS